MAVGTRTLRKGELLAILGEIYRDRDTGTLVLQQGDVSRFLYIQDGMVIFAASNAPDDKFTQILVDQGKLTQEQLALATEKKENRTIGRTLVDMGFLGSGDLLDALVAQLRKIAFSAVNWEGGTGAFKPGVLPSNVAKLPISTPRFLVDLALAVEDRQLVASSLGQLDAPVLLSPAEREAARSLPPSAQEARLLEQVDGNRTAREICERGGVDLFTGSRFLLGLSHLGLLHVRQIIAPTPAQAPAPEPDELDFLGAPEPDEPEADAAPAPAAPPPTPQGLPFGAAAPGPPREEALPPTPAGPSRRRTAGKAFPELLPAPGAEAGSTPSSPEPPAFLLESPPSRGRWFAIVLAVLFVAGGAAGSVWYFFLRPSGIIPIEPAPHRRLAPPVRPPAETAPAAIPAPSPSGPSESAVKPVAPSADATTPPAPAPQAPAAEPAAPAVQARPPSAEREKALPASTTAFPPPAPEDARNLLVEGRYPEAARAFRKSFDSRRGGFVINIEVACQEETVVRGLAAAMGRQEYALLPYSLKGRPCYLVVWGYYPDKAAAEAALKELPSFFLQAAQPRVVPWSKVVELSGPP